MVYYERQRRTARTSKIPFAKMLAFALEGITSLSVRPIRLLTALGVAVFPASLGIIGYFLVQHYSGDTVSGWSSLIVSVWAIGGLVLLSIGVVGAYVGKIHLETRERLRFIIETFQG